MYTVCTTKYFIKMTLNLLKCGFFFFKKDKKDNQNKYLKEIPI